MLITSPFYRWSFVPYILQKLCRLSKLSSRGHGNNLSLFHDFHIRWCSCRLTVTWQVTLVEQVYQLFPSTRVQPPIFSAVRVARSLVFCVLCCWSLFLLLSLFFWPLRCLSIFDLWILITPLVSYWFWLPLWFLTDSDYPFGFFKLFNSINASCALKLISAFLLIILCCIIRLLIHTKYFFN